MLIESMPRRRRAVVVIHGTNFNVTGSVLNCDLFIYFSFEVWTANFSIINILSRYLKV